MATRMLTLLIVTLTALSTTAVLATVPDPEVDPEAATFIRGDVDDSGLVQLNDAIQVLRYVFHGDGDFRCLKAADANDDGMIDVSDPVMILEVLFGEENMLVAPFPTAGVDVTADDLPCEVLDNRPHEENTDPVWHVVDNGTVCIADPCFNWTIVGEGESRTVSDVDVSGLLFDDEMSQDLLDELAAGVWLVRGHLVRGPEGSAGTGTTLVVTALEGFFEGGNEED